MKFDKESNPTVHKTAKCSLQFSNSTLVCFMLKACWEIFLSLMMTFVLLVLLVKIKSKINLSVLLCFTSYHIVCGPFCLCSFHVKQLCVPVKNDRLIKTHHKNYNYWYAITTCCSRSFYLLKFFFKLLFGICGLYVSLIWVYMLWIWVLKKEFPTLRNTWMKYIVLLITNFSQKITPVVFPVTFD